MKTSFRLLPLESNPNVNWDYFRQALPHTFEVEVRKNDVYIAVKTSKQEDQCAQYLVDRELDRLFFLTNVRFHAEMIRHSVHADVKCSYSVQAALDSQISPLTWTYECAIQLRLWAMSSHIQDPIVRMLMLFQIIELSKPAFPIYQDAQVSPNPLTECKLLRHLIVHAGEVGNLELKTYCEHLRLPPMMLDRTDPEHVGIIAAKLNLMEGQARQCLEDACKHAV